VAPKKTKITRKVDRLNKVVTPEGDPERAGAMLAPPRRRRAGTRKQDWIGSHLRHVYDEALTESIPDDMLSLLNQLDEAAKRGKGGS
jgi:hypothetical protein